MGHAFFEASSIRKVGDKYYVIYSAELSHEVCYAVSDSPCRGLVYGGTLVDNADLGCLLYTSHSALKCRIAGAQPSAVKVTVTPIYVFQDSSLLLFGEVRQASFDSPAQTVRRQVMSIH